MICKVIVVAVLINFSRVMLINKVFFLSPWLAIPFPFFSHIKSVHRTWGFTAAHSLALVTQKEILVYDEMSEERIIVVSLFLLSK